MPLARGFAPRIQMEGEGPYGLGKSPSRKTLREAMAMTAPVEGIITEKFDTKLGQYGIRIAAAPGSQVSAVDNGTVVLSLWSPEEGYVVQVQHADNVLSIYKNLAQSMVSTASPAPQRRGAGIQQRPAGRRHRLETLRLRTVERRQARRSPKVTSYSNGTFRRKGPHA